MTNGCRIASRHTSLVVMIPAGEWRREWAHVVSSPAWPQGAAWLLGVGFDWRLK